VKKDPYPQENNEKAIGPEVPYLNAIGVLMYLANSSDPTRRHWNRIKYVLRYLCVMRDM
jgi:hypothetical protein